MLGGPYRSEGILELYFFKQWGGVCGRSFDMIAANAVCNALGYTGSKNFSFVSRYSVDIYVRVIGNMTYVQ